MTEKEKMYYERFGKQDYLILKEACEIWRKPGYSSLSKKLPEIGYSNAVKQLIIPPYVKEGRTYLFKISDILDFLNRTRSRHE